MNINNFIDHTILKADASESDIKVLCQEAKEYQFYAVCINGCYVSLATKELVNTSIKIAAVIGFPLGAMSTQAKIFEAKQCIADGAHEIDMVINIGALKDGYTQYVEDEIRDIKQAIGTNVLKVIIEACLLTESQKKLACQLVINAGADYIKTSTGFSIHGATVEDVALLIAESQGKIKVKAAGGIKNIAPAQQYVDMGVQRLGTSSGVALMKNETPASNY